MNKKLTSTFLGLLFAGCATTANTTVDKDPVAEETPTAVTESKPSSITFVGGSNIIKHDGEFPDFTADLIPNETEPENLEKAQFDLTIDLTSTVTDTDMLTGHLQKDDFFDTANYPEATFSSTEITQVDGNNYDITGDLTIKGTTKQVVINTEITDEYLKGTYDLPRREFNIGNDSYGDKLLDETVTVTAYFQL